MDRWDKAKLNVPPNLLCDINHLQACGCSQVLNLIPVDAVLEDSTVIDFETIYCNLILEFMSEAKRASVALLDA